MRKLLNWKLSFYKSEKLPKFALFVHFFGVKTIIFSKMDLIFIFHTQKLFWKENFSQIGETSKICPFCLFLPFLGVKIIIFSKMDRIFKFHTQKLFWEQNFSQIGVTSKMWPILPLFAFTSQG